MGRINIGRVIVSGLVIGALTNIGYALVMAWLLLWPWKGALAAIGRPPLWFFEIILLCALGFVTGLGAAFIYAGFRPRFGPGPRTALIVGATVWALSHVTVFGYCVALGMPAEVMSATAGIGLIISLVATLAGAALYRENN
jgi:hypothetical protein